MTQKPILKKPIPPQVVNEGSAYGPFPLSDYIVSPDEESGTVRFNVGLDGDLPLPKGLICTPEGLLSGIPGKGTHGAYEFIVMAMNDAMEGLETKVQFNIREANILDENSQYFTNLKSQVWEALGKNLPIPELGELFQRPLTPAEIYYLLQRFATLTIWDVYNLDSPTDKKLLNLKGASPHYEVYDRGSCIVGHPKDLFSHDRSLYDVLETAKAMARHVYDLGWTIEFAGFDKMCRASWVELQLLADKHGKPIEILHFQPSLDDFKLYEKEAKALSMALTSRGG